MTFPPGFGGVKKAAPTLGVGTALQSATRERGEKTMPHDIDSLQDPAATRRGWTA